METRELVAKVQEKKEFKELPESLIEKVLLLKEIVKLQDEEKIKQARALLRKYFTVFLSNKITKGKLGSEELLKRHISSKNRDYAGLYKRIIGNEKTIIDLGAGLNGLSIGGIGKKYVAVEATRVLVEIMNNYFKQNKIPAEATWEDLFNLNKILEIVKNTEKPRAIWVFNIIDALEYLERDYSKKLLLELKNQAEKIIISWPTQSLQKQKKFKAKRFWILNFLEENFNILDEFEANGEKFIVLNTTKA